MAIIAPVENGKIAENTSAKNKTEDKNTADKDMFLKLLVAEMQYQDPLEPTSNTDYVKELASFSQIEAVQAVQGQMSTLEANSLVGKYVELLTTDASGNSEYVSGKVDFVMNQDDEMMLSVNGKLYSINDLESVCDEKYFNGINNAETFHNMVSKMPTAYQLTLLDEGKLKEAREFLDGLSDYDFGFVAVDDAAKLAELEARMEALKKSAEEVKEKENESNESN